MLIAEGLASGQKKVTAATQAKSHTEDVAATTQATHKQQQATSSRRINVRLIELIKPTHKHKIVTSNCSVVFVVVYPCLASACLLIKLLLLSLLLLLLLLLWLHDLLSLPL